VAGITHFLPKTKGNIMPKQIFHFRVFYTRDVYRDIEIAGTDSLYDLASIIIQSFNFDFDHAFGFYSNLKKYYDSAERYELFADLEDVGMESDALSVKNTAINSVFTEKKDMLFFFDYGDCWQFKVHCMSVQPSKKGQKYPHCSLTKGTAPIQYPPFEDEEDAA
jgi:hypothetical protein